MLRRHTITGTGNVSQRSINMIYRHEYHGGESESVFIEKTRQLFHQLILEDIEENKQPAIVYSYNNRTGIFNAIDDIRDWDVERNKFASMGWKQGFLQLDLKIRDKIWECVLWYFQPLKDGLETNQNEINLPAGIIQHGRGLSDLKQKEYFDKTFFKCDPLGYLFGYSIAGICYLRVSKQKNDRRPSMKRNRIYNVIDPPVTKSLGDAR